MAFGKTKIVKLHDKLESALDKYVAHLRESGVNDEKIKDLLLGFENLEYFFKEKEAIKVEAHVLDYQTPKLRNSGDLWTTELVYDFLLKVFDSYDFEHLRFDPDRKRRIANQFDLTIEYITNQANLFVNKTLQSDKYELLKRNLFTEVELTNWKTRNK